MLTIDYSTNNSYIGDSMAIPIAKPAETVDDYQEDTAVTVTVEDEYDDQYSADIEGYDPDDPTVGVYQGEDQHYDDDGGAVLQQAQNMLSSSDNDIEMVPAGETASGESPEEYQEQEQEQDEGIGNSGDGMVPVQFKLPQTDQGTLSQFNMSQFLSHIKQMKPEELNQTLGKICSYYFL